MEHEEFLAALNNASYNVFVEREDIVSTKLKSKSTSVFFIDKVDRPAVIMFQEMDIVTSSLIGRLLWVDNTASRKFITRDASDIETKTSSSIFVETLNSLKQTVEAFCTQHYPQSEVESLMKYVCQISTTVEPSVLNALTLALVSDFWDNDVPYDEMCDLLSSSLYDRSNGIMVISASEYKQYAGQPTEWLEKIFIP